MTKRALILIREEIQRSWQDKVKLVMTVHDQIDTICIKDCAQDWSSNNDKSLWKMLLKKSYPVDCLKLIQILQCAGKNNSIMNEYIGYIVFIGLLLILYHIYENKNN